MFARLRPSFALCLLLAASACKGGGDPVQEVCDVLLTCSCSVPPYATADACVSDINQEIDALKAEALSAGLSYNPACLDAELNELAGFGCGGSYPELDPSSCSYCSPVHGDKPAGAACSEVDGWSDCASNLICISGTCADVCSRLSAGEACIDADFNSLGACAEGLYCDFNDTLTCKQAVDVGGDCSVAFCKETLVCDADNVCAAPPKEGEACVFECGEALVCDTNSVCVPLPGEGESCAEISNCADGLYCGPADLCVTAEPLLCEIFGDL